MLISVPGASSPVGPRGRAADFAGAVGDFDDVTADWTVDDGHDKDGPH